MEIVIISSIIKIIISLVICNTEYTETNGQLWLIKSEYNQMDNQHIIIINIQLYILRRIVVVNSVQMR